MTAINDSNLLTPSELKEFFQKTQEGKVFRGSFEEVFLKNYGSDGEKRILTPIIFKLDIGKDSKFAGKLVTLDNNDVNIDIYKDLFEADNLLLLMSYLIKDYLQIMFSGISNEMTFKEIALILGDKQFVVGERVRQLLVGLCTDLEKVLHNKHHHE